MDSLPKGIGDPAAHAGAAVIVLSGMDSLPKGIGDVGSGAATALACPTVRDGLAAERHCCLARRFPKVGVNVPGRPFHRVELPLCDDACMPKRENQGIEQRRMSIKQP